MILVNVIIEKIKITNFRRFKDTTEVNFNDELNVLIGDNESGKSTILLAIDLLLSGSVNKINSIGLENLFCKSVIKEFMDSDRNYDELPEITIEAFVKNVINEDLEGENNSEKVNCPGIKLLIQPDENYSKQIKEVLENENSIFPFEYYSSSFKTFTNSTYNNYIKPFKHIMIDSVNINSDYAMKDYVNSMYSAHADSAVKNIHNNRFRQLKHEFVTNELKEFNEKFEQIKFGLSTNTKFNLESNLVIYDNDINIWDKGTGKQCIIKTQLAIEKQVDNIDFILIEEPENHLSFQSMMQMLDNITSSNEKQLFITTHNNMICSRLNLNNLICLSGSDVITKSFRNIDPDTAKFFQKAPSNNILNFILSKNVILVEGAAEYILLEKFYEIINKNTPAKDCVEIISINGLSFLRYLEISNILKTRTVVITDNDKSYLNNVTNKYVHFKDINFIEVFADENDTKYTFEVSLYENNKNLIDSSDITISEDKQTFMLNNKAESAYRILNKLNGDNDFAEKFVIPEYIKKALLWIKN